MDLLAQHATEELNSEENSSALATLAAISNKAEPTQILNPLALAVSGVQVDELHQKQQPNDEEEEDEENGDEVEDGPQEDKTTQSKKRKQKSMYKGVFKCGKKFKAQIQTRGVQHYLGLYDSEEEAARAYDNHARLVLGARARTNFPYDHRDPVPEPILPLPLIPPTPPAKKARNDEQQLDDKSGPLKRSYIGIKSRKKTRDVINGILLEKQAREAMGAAYEIYAKNSMHAPNSSVPSTALGMRPDGFAGHSLVSLPLTIPYGTIPNEFAPVVTNDSLLTSAILASGASAAARNNSLLSNLQRPAAGILSAPPPMYAAAADLSSSYPYTAVTLPPAEPDWRDQIYYWVGKLSYDDKQQCLRWRGRWMGSFSGKPAESEFDSSSNEFTYCSPRIEKARAFSSQGLLRPISGHYAGQYGMDNDGSGVIEMYTDKELLMEFEETSLDPCPQYFVYGRGDSEFGEFIVHGTYDSSTRMLDMSRQYLSDNDLKRMMTMPQLKLHIKRLYRYN